MKERTLHYIWQNRLYDSVTVDGEPVTVLDVGQYNIGAGPDFLVAKVEIGSIVWVGAVEIHIQASDWYHHGHDTDERYDNVVLHVVLTNDRPTTNATKRSIPTATLHVEKSVIRRIEALEEGPQALRCAPEISAVDLDRIHDLTPRLLQDRMLQKLDKLTDAEEPYATTFFYRSLLRYLGAHQNNDAMEQVARSLPYTYLKKHASDLTALEAMLLGQAGLIEEQPRDEYEAKLYGEYAFYRQKFGLTPLPHGLFKKLRVRPPSYPTRMLAIAAQLIHREDELRASMVAQDYTTLTDLLSHPPSDYWQRHIDFSHPAKRKMGGPGQTTLLSLLINAIIPTAYLYGRSTGDRGMAEAAIAYLSTLPPEQNRIVRLFSDHGIAPRSSADTQAILQLHEHYCAPYSCLTCPVAPLIFQHLHFQQP